MALDPKHLPEDPKVLQQMVLDLMAQLDHEFTERNKIEALLRELLDAKRNRKSEQLSADQLALFAELLQARQAQAESPVKGGDSDDDAVGGGTGDAAPKRRTGGRQPLPKNLLRERIVHDLGEEEKHCASCQKDLRPIGEETSERYEYIPAQLKVVEDVCKKYACDCTVKTATKPPQPIEKSTAGASLLAQVIVAKTADHLPLHRQEKIFERHGADISRKTMCGWMAQCGDLLGPLYGAAKAVLFQSKTIGTDDTGVKVLDEKLPFARTGRIWPYCGDKDHPVILYDYTKTRARAGPEEFLKGYRGRLQADAYGGYDAFFKDPKRDSSLDVFDLMYGIKRAMEDNDAGTLEKRLNDLDRAQDQVLSRRADVGSVRREMEDQLDKNKDREFQGIKQMSELEDLDFPAAVTEMNLADVRNKATLDTSGRLIQPSLLNFLR